LASECNHLVENFVNNISTEQYFRIDDLQQSKENKERSNKMNTRNEAILPRPIKRKPLFASPWVALFLLLRSEYYEFRNSK
jgi:hypothetical protein